MTTNIRHPEKIHKTSNPIPKKPPWIRVKAPTSKVFKLTNEILKKITRKKTPIEISKPKIMYLRSFILRSTWGFV